MSGTFLGFDFGTKSIGVAVGQRITATARPLPALKAQDGKPDWNVIEKLLKEWQPEAVIVGLPLNMDGTEQPLTARARNFANKIHGRFGVAILLHDERLSTVEARAGLNRTQPFIVEKDRDAKAAMNFIGEITRARRQRLLGAVHIERQADDYRLRLPLFKQFFDDVPVRFTVLRLQRR